MLTTIVLVTDLMQLLSLRLRALCVPNELGRTRRVGQMVLRIMVGWTTRQYNWCVAAVPIGEERKTGDRLDRLIDIDAYRVGMWRGSHQNRASLSTLRAYTTMSVSRRRIGLLPKTYQLDRTPCALCPLIESLFLLCLLQYIGRGHGHKALQMNMQTLHTAQVFV